MERKSGIALGIGALAAAAVFAALQPHAGRAEGEGEGARALKIGYVDLGRAFKQYSLTRSLAEELRSWKAGQEQVMEKKKAELLALRDRIAAMKGEDARGAHGSMIGLNKELSELGDKLQAEYSRRVLENDRKVYSEVCAAIDSVASEGGWDLVLQIRDRDIAADDVEVQALNIRSRTVLHGSPRIDLTELVLESLEKSKEEKK